MTDKSALQLIQEVRADLYRRGLGGNYGFADSDELIAKLAEAERRVTAMRAAVEDVERRLRLWPDVTGDPDAATLWGLHADPKVTALLADALRKALEG